MDSGTLPNDTKKTRLLIIVEAHPENLRLLRYAKRQAQNNGREWEALIIETPTLAKAFNAQDRDQLLQAMTVAQNLGGVVTHWHAKSYVDGIVQIVEKRKNQNIDINEIIVEKTTDEIFPLNLFSLFKTSLIKKLRKNLDPQIQITPIALGQVAHNRNHVKNLIRTNLYEIFLSLMAVFVATAVIYTLDALWPNEIITSENRNKSIIYMVACAFAAVNFGLLSGMVAGVASFLMMSSLFLSSEKFLINDFADLVNLLLFLLATTFIALFSDHKHHTHEILSSQVDRLQSLLRIHRITLNQHTPEDALKTLDEELSKLLSTEIVFFIPSEKNPDILEPAFKKNLTLSSEDQKALRLCRLENKTTGVGSPYEFLSNWRFEPLISAQSEIGVLGIFIHDKIVLNPTFCSLVHGIADQAALIIERLKIEEQAEEGRVQAERDSLRAMLLSSVSHDLKTPLASVIGSLSVFRSLRSRLSEEHQMTLLNTALDEAQRLDSFITNILDMTRLESGQVKFKEEWMDPDEVIRDVQKRLRDRLRFHEVVVKGSGLKNIQVCMDSMMTSQVLQNLLDNAAKYTAPGSRIEVSWRIENEKTFCYEVRDFGTGIPLEFHEKIFDKYARIQRQDSQIAGTGLGLAIARATIQAQGGKILVANHEEGGAVFTFTLPRWRSPTGEQKVA